MVWKAEGLGGVPLWRGLVGKGNHLREMMGLVLLNKNLREPIGVVVDVKVVGLARILARLWLHRDAGRREEVDIRGDWGVKGGLEGGGGVKVKERVCHHGLGVLKDKVVPRGLLELDAIELLLNTGRRGGRGGLGPGLVVKGWARNLKTLSLPGGWWCRGHQGGSRPLLTLQRTLPGGGGSHGAGRTGAALPGRCLSRRLGGGGRLGG